MTTSGHHNDQPATWSRVVLFGAAVFLLLASFAYYPRWQQEATEATISWDVSGYYMYLPATIIYGDLKQLSFRNDVIETYRPSPDFQQGYRGDNGNFILKYPAGMAILYSPWFFMAHAYALVTHYPADGFSLPYQFMISLGSLLVAFIGLLLLRRVLLRYFDDKNVAITLAGIVLATNYLDYTAFNGAMTHNYLFTLYAGLLLLTEKFYTKPSTGLSIGIGILLGLMALVRPTEILAVFLVLIWGVGLPLRKGLLNRWAFFRQHRAKALVGMCAAAVLGLIQLGYWKYVSGDWIVYSYQDQGFSWLRPHIWNGIFSYNNGWLVYTPVMCLAIAGFVPLFRKRHKLAISILAYFLLFVYIAFAWDIWWYGGSLGQRTMVQMYPVLSVPFTATVVWAWQKNWSKVMLVVFGAGCIYLNLWWTHQAHKGGMFHPEQMNRAYFWEVLGRFDKQEEDLELLDNSHRYKGNRKEETLMTAETFEAETNLEHCGGSPISGSGSVCLWSGNPKSPVVSASFEGIPGRRYWARAEAEFLCVRKEWNVWQMAQFIIVALQDGEVKFSRSILVHRLLYDGERQTIDVEMRLPNVPVDEIQAYVWNGGSPEPLLVDNLSIYAWPE